MFNLQSSAFNSGISGLGIGIFLIMVCGCASFGNTSSIDADYKILLSEQVEIQQNKELNFLYRQILKDSQAFKEQLYAAIKERYAKQFRDDELEHIRKLLTEKRSVVKYLPDAGTAIFKRFQGLWRGHWYQNRRTTTYEQTWSPPYRINDGLIAQKVIIRKWNNRYDKPADEIVAINSYNPKTNIILGAVDVAKAGPKRTRAPHLGFYIDSSTLSWIGCFGHDSEIPSYSFFFEKVYLIDRVNHYRVRGVEFKWNRRLQRLTDINWCEGHYIRIM